MVVYNIGGENTLWITWDKILFPIPKSVTAILLFFTVLIVLGIGFLILTFSDIWSGSQKK